MNIPEPLQSAIDELHKLPSIGKKTAVRLALHLLKSDKDSVTALADSLIRMKEDIHFCKKCFNFATEELCDICNNPKREQNQICVVEEPGDIIAIEKTNEFNGLYHVLGGVLSPLEGTGAESLKISELINRIKTEAVSEVILALNASTEGETTSLYLAKLIKPYEIKVSRIARGLPIGGDLEFADEATIGRAMLGRINL